jgi:hypothetical protein
LSSVHVEPSDAREYPSGHVGDDDCGGGVVVVLLPLLSLEPEEPLLPVEPLLSVCANANVGSALSNIAITGTSKIALLFDINTFLYLFVIIHESSI